jgi:hypothetical protein
MKFVFDAQESRKQNKNTVERKKKDEYIIQKSETFFITIGALCVLSRRTKFYLQSNWLYFELNRLFNLLAR